MMRETKLMVGIDISKKTFDVAFPYKDGFKCKSFSNDTNGFKSLMSQLTPQMQCVMEASGPYSLRLASYLHHKNVLVSVVNPLVIKRFSQMRLIRTKTDKADAKMIAQYGLAEQPERWIPPQIYIQELQQLQTVIEQLEKQYVALSNQLEAFTQSGVKNRCALQIIKQSLKQISKQLKVAAEQMESIVHKHHKEQMILLTSIPGIGKKTAMLLIVITGGFQKFENAKQLSSFVGICPRIIESGTSVKGKSRICKLGMGRVRKFLYLCAWSAIKKNLQCKQLYERLLAKGKAKMVALIAVANKLLRQAFAIAVNSQPYTENYYPKTCF